jgi:hypothetical protein
MPGLRDALQIFDDFRHPGAEQLRKPWPGSSA